MLFKEIITVYTEKRKKPINTTYIVIGYRGRWDKQLFSDGGEIASFC
jgi:hypothetical protein